MTVDIEHTNSELSAARELRAVMQGTVVLRSDGDYARTRQIWNRAVENQPAPLRCVRRPRTCGRRCVSRVDMAYRSRCAAAGIIGRDSQAGGYTS
jgi:hypothetical protein